MGLKAQELREQSTDEIEATLEDLRKELFSVVNEARISKKLEKPHEIKALKKDIARILTVLNEKQKVS